MGTSKSQVRRNAQYEISGQQPTQTGQPTKVQTTAQGKSSLRRNYETSNQKGKEETNFHKKKEKHNKEITEPKGAPLKPKTRAGTIKTSLTDWDGWGAWIFNKKKKNPKAPQKGHDS